MHMKKTSIIRRGCYWVTLDPTVGTEMKKTRPAVVVSIDSANRALSRVVILPITSNVSSIFPAECLVTMNGVQHKVIASQIRTVSKLRVGNYIAELSIQDMNSVESAIKLHLGIE